MDFTIPTGKYVVAVSGGVDSVVLLHQLQVISGLELVVAHFDHGMRPSSQLDEQFVAELARSYRLQYHSATGKLGAGASEARARTARYAFLQGVMAETHATAIITAHHEDDVLETAIINLARGTGRRGLTSLASSDTLLRPMLALSKVTIREYAKQQNLKWREDESNDDTQYLRNHIRANVIPRFSSPERIAFLRYIKTLRGVNQELDDLLKSQVTATADAQRFDRDTLRQVPDAVARELLAAWWRNNGFTSYESKTLQRALKDGRTLQKGGIIPLKGRYKIIVERDYLALSISER